MSVALDEFDLDVRVRELSPAELGYAAALDAVAITKGGSCGPACRSVED